MPVKEGLYSLYLLQVQIAKIFKDPVAFKNTLINTSSKNIQTAISNNACSAKASHNYGEQ